MTEYRIKDWCIWSTYDKYIRVTGLHNYKLVTSAPVEAVRYREILDSDGSCFILVGDENQSDWKETLKRDAPKSYKFLKNVLLFN